MGDYELGHAARLLAAKRVAFDRLVSRGSLNAESRTEEELLKQHIETLVAQFGPLILDKMSEELQAFYNTEQPSEQQ